ncbi:hypothetical protein D3C74_371320 [compost metagenome]
MNMILAVAVRDNQDTKDGQTQAERGSRRHEDECGLPDHMVTEQKDDIQVIEHQNGAGNSQANAEVAAWIAAGHTGIPDAEVSGSPAAGHGEQEMQYVIFRSQG